MALRTTALTNLLVDRYVEKTFLDTLWANAFVTSLGVPSTITENNGLNIRWQIPTELSAATTALTEGVDPVSSESIVTTAFDAVLAEYGTFQDYSRLLMTVGLSATHDMYAREIGHQGSRTLDTISMADLDGSATVVDSGVSMTAESLRNAVRTLRINKARPHRGTPGGRFYCAIFAPDSFYDMIGEGAPTWVQAKSRDIEASLTDPLSNTPATSALYGAVVKISDEVQTVASEYLNVVIGDQAFGVASLDSTTTKPRIILTRPDELVSSPQRLKGTIAWYILFASKRFGDAKTIVTKADI